MSAGTIKRVSASAGSGKTFRLTSLYLESLFSDRDSYQRILAVTFTNKATAEMKGRILDQLHILSTGGQSEYLEKLMITTARDESYVRRRAGEILYSILHDFSRFSVCTIDTFFQKIIRAFARETGLNSGFSIELDHNIILSAAVDEMLAASETDPAVRDWLTEYVNVRLVNETRWNPRDDIIKLAAEIFKERFKILSSEEKEKLEDKKYLQSYISKLRAICDNFETSLRRAGEESLKFFAKFDLTDEMFFQKGRGVPGFIKSIAGGNVTDPNSYVRKILDNPPKWYSGKPDPQLLTAISKGLEETVSGAIRFYDSGILHYKSAIEVLANIYIVGLLSDILKKVRSVSADENRFLISEANELLALITSGDQAPFIYERIGNRYEKYMIDEFQDTSLMQWINFQPLISESLGRGNDNLVVGDIKQSIYRFRNSDWRILGTLLDDQFSGERLISEALKTNWRSRPDIIRFNNSIFSAIPVLLDRELKDFQGNFRFSSVYSEVIQDDPGKKEGGYVKIEFIDDDTGLIKNRRGKEYKKVLRKWEDKVYERIPAIIERIQDQGYSASDIGIIVRYGREGTEILNSLIEYANNAPKEKRDRYNYNVVSDYSLTLSNSPAVNFLISALRVIAKSDDEISMAAMLRNFLLVQGRSDAGSILLIQKRLKDASHGYYPAHYQEFMKRVSGLQLFQAVEELIEFFGLGANPANAAFLNTFQDFVLSFSIKNNGDMESFLDWWDKSGKGKSVVLPATQDAARIFTIHKSKGLEFSVVILPFLSWNLDHHPLHGETLWVRPPDVAPFNELGILPVKYYGDPSGTIFSESMIQEKLSAYLDNINLLYVAMTRAKDAIFGFAAQSPDAYDGISRILKSAMSSETNSAGHKGICLKDYYSDSGNTFEFGEMPSHTRIPLEKDEIISDSYRVKLLPESLRLKLHGENYFLPGREHTAGRINYGKLMHSLFERIDTINDIPEALGILVNQGLIPDSDIEPLKEKLRGLLSSPEVSGWFNPDNMIIRESDILLPSGSTKRPDRIIVAEGKVIIIDFKFGEERRHHFDQIREYGNILSEMGYKGIECWLWYVDDNKVVRA